MAVAQSSTSFALSKSTRTWSCALIPPPVSQSCLKPNTFQDRLSPGTGSSTRSSAFLISSFPANIAVGCPLEYLPLCSERIIRQEQACCPFRRSAERVQHLTATCPEAWSFRNSHTTSDFSNAKRCVEHRQPVRAMLGNWCFSTTPKTDAKVTASISFCRSLQTAVAFGSNHCERVHIKSRNGGGLPEITAKDTQTPGRSFADVPSSEPLSRSATNLEDVRVISTSLSLNGRS